MVDAAVAAVGAAAVVFGPELAAGAAVLKTGELIWEASEIGGTLLMIGAGANALATGVSTVVGRPAEEVDMTGYDSAFGTPNKKPTPGGVDENILDQGQATDGKVPEKGGDSQTETEYESKWHPICFPAKSGDYAGIQKTMYDPVSGNVLGLKMHARAKRGSFTGPIRNVLHALRRSRVKVHHVKVTSHSPVRPLGVWDSAYRH